MALSQKDEVSKLLDIEEFKQIVSLIQETRAAIPRADYITQLLSLPGLAVHHQCGVPKKQVLAEFDEFEHQHERETAYKLAEEGYDVLFVPTGCFSRSSKRFDVYLCKGHIFLEADLKALTTKNPDTIGQRIREGSDQASRVVVDIKSDINAKTLIDGLKLGSERNNNLLQIILLYKNRCSILNKEQILSKKIFNLIQ